MFERRMDVLSILKCIEGRTTDDLDVEQIKRWIVPDLRSEIIKAYFTLRCNTGKTREFIGKDFLEGLVEGLERESD